MVCITDGVYLILVSYLHRYDDGCDNDILWLYRSVFFLICNLLFQ